MNEITTILCIAAGVVLAVSAIAVIGRYTLVVTLWEREAGLLFKHGKFVRELAAGHHRLWGVGYQVLTFETRWRELQVVGQEMLTGDRATVRLTAVVIYRIGNAHRFHSIAEDATRVLYTGVQLVLRDLAAGRDLEALVEGRDDLGKELVARLAATAGEIGVEIREAAIRDLTIGGDLKRAYAGVIQARAESQAAVEKARGESAAIRTLANAARSFENNPHLLQLRYLQMLEEKGASCGSTFVLGDPQDWLRKNT